MKELSLKQRRGGRKGSWLRKKGGTFEVGGVQSDRMKMMRERNVPPPTHTRPYWNIP